MILETERLILRGWRDDDAASLFKYAKDERIGFWAGWLPHSNERYSRAVIRTVLCKKETFAICLKGTDDPIGSIGLTLSGSDQSPLLEHEAELGYWVGVPFWGRGIATEAAKEMLRHGFEDLELRQIYCGYFQGNNRSKNVQQKCGFKFHHTNEKSQVIMLDETRVEHINSISAEDWRRRM